MHTQTRYRLFPDKTDYDEVTTQLCWGPFVVVVVVNIVVVFLVVVIVVTVNVVVVALLVVNDYIIFSCGQ